MTDERLSLMNKTRENLQSELEVVLRDLKLQQAWQNIVFELVQRKFEHLDVRSSFAVAIYEYIQLLTDKEKVELKGLKDDVLFRRQLPFVADMVIAIQYLKNHILDEKQQADSRLELRSTLFSIIHSLLISREYDWQLRRS